MSVTRCDKLTFRCVAPPWFLSRQNFLDPVPESEQLEFGEFVRSVVPSTKAHKPHKAHANITCSHHWIFFCGVISQIYPQLSSKDTFTMLWCK